MTFKGIRTFCCLFLWFPLAATAAELVAVKTTDLPVIDGSADASIWEKAPELSVTDGVSDVQIKLRALHDGQYLYFLAIFADEDESRLHKPHVWNPAIELYDTGNQREDTLVFKWNMTPYPVDLTLSSEIGYRADIWFWKAHRTDSSGFADDKTHNYSPHRTSNSLPVTSEKGALFYLTRRGDQGSAAYRVVLQDEYQGDQLSGYEFQKPSGSRADIEAKGQWQAGFWTVEFKRKLDTGHSDDIQISHDKPVYFAVSRYEIAGRSVNQKLSQPLYGAGEVGELITLKLEP